MVSIPMQLYPKQNNITTQIRKGTVFQVTNPVPLKGDLKWRFLLMQMNGIFEWYQILIKFL